MPTPVDVVERLLQARTSVLGGETQASTLAAGRVLAEPVRSPVNVPGFVRAAMDGFAVRSQDTAAASPENPGSLIVVGEARPARPFTGTMSAGQAVHIATGAPVPSGADSILVAEQARLEPDGRVMFAAPVAAGRHIARVGEDVERGREVLAAGRRLRPQDVGLLAAIGVRSVPVIRQPRIAILATGSELLPPGSEPSGFAIVDSNSPMLAALIQRDGGICQDVRYVPDDSERLREAIRETVEQVDVVMISGGSSVGAEDHAPRIVSELGELAVHGIAVRPGGPTGIAFVQRSAGEAGSPPVPVFLLPGNPVACLCAYDLFAGRVIRRMGGRPWELPYRAVHLPLAAAVKSVVGRVQYVRVNVSAGRVAPLSAGGASILSSAVAADGFILTPQERDQLAEGEVTTVWLYDA
jgi:molybdopterin molybdotransferase